MKAGYSYATVQDNLRKLLASGLNATVAAASAYSAARKQFFRKYPSGALPAWLAYSGLSRTRQAYTEEGYPLRRNPAGIARRVSTSQNRSDVAKAQKLIESFSGHKARIYGKVRIPELPKTAIAIGHVLGIAYSTKRDGEQENYYHRFTLKSARPLLASTPDGQRLFLIGGSYSFTERGIMDKRKRP